MSVRVAAYRGNARQAKQSLVQYLYAEVNKKVRRFDDILEKLQKDYPELRFRVGRKFMFRGPRTVVFEQKNGVEREDCNLALERANKITKNEQKWAESTAKTAEIEQNREILQLLHEMGHAILRHRDYGTDAERLKMERAAWEKARDLTEVYGVEYDAEFVEEELDTYRDWLYRRSRCKKCGATRYQTPDGRYHCAVCEAFEGKTQ